MAQDLTVNIKTTSDVPQAMDKAKQATTEFAKQAEAVNKRFGDSIKDIILSTAGPMAALALVTSRINEYFEKIKQAREDANKSAIDGVNQLMAREDVYYARKVARENEEKKNRKDASRQPQTTAFEFLMNDDRAKSISPLMAGASDMRLGPTDKTVKEMMAERLSKDPAVQEKIRKIVAEDLLKNGMILNAGEIEAAKRASDQAAAAKAKADAEDEKKRKSDEIKLGSSVSGNVIGVGANPVVTALQEQQAIAREQLAYLQIIASQSTNTRSADVTASGATPSTPANASPSRAALVTKNK